MAIAEVQKSKVNKGKSKKASTVGLRVGRETKRRVLAELAKANKKEFGKMLRCEDLIAVAVSLITDQHIKILQAGSLSNSDRLEIQYREFVKKNGATSKDEFLGKILLGSVAVQDQKLAP